MDGRKCGGAPQPHPDHHGGGLRPLPGRGSGMCDRQQRAADTPLADSGQGWGQHPQYVRVLRGWPRSHPHGPRLRLLQQGDLRHPLLAESHRHPVRLHPGHLPHLQRRERLHPRTPAIRRAAACSRPSPAMTATCARRTRATPRVAVSTRTTRRHAPTAMPVRRGKCAVAGRVSPARRETATTATPAPTTAATPPRGVSTRTTPPRATTAPAAPTVTGAAPEPASAASRPTATMATSARTILAARAPAASTTPTRRPATMGTPAPPTIPAATGAVSADRR